MSPSDPTLQPPGRSRPETAGPDLRLVGSEEVGDWEAVYRQNVVPLYRFVHARTGNRPDAEDITAQAFLRALPRLREGASAPEVRSYLFVTARTVLADHWAERYSVETSVLHDDIALTPEEAQSGDGGAGRAAAILDRLPDNYRRVLELRFLRGYSVRDTAREMGVTVTNAKVLQWRALRHASRIQPELLP